MSWTREDVRHRICELYNGKSLTEVIGEGYEYRASFFYYVFNDPELSAEYARAQEARAELFADQIVEISDNEIDPQKARNRIGTRQWYASKMQPKKYGERITHDVNQTVSITSALEDAKRRALPASYHKIEDGPQVPEYKPYSPKVKTDSQSVLDDKRTFEGIETGDADEIESDDIFK
ncbi:hypothetical protein E6Q11_02420 [Candidatus Dojkabacteria bacterium]|uniref:Uncharacterized protein n=1 Tax=Candidatus Dojkabacteria bacterium TaxID=2099670 RepID=A0A5C7J856_9BACT|nr:MAG: hypothetical protein E6Q11_02420 [Candidatus Dojkabacteria bacterium]